MFSAIADAPVMTVAAAICGWYFAVVAAAGAVCGCCWCCCSLAAVAVKLSVWECLYDHSQLLC